MPEGAAAFHAAFQEIFNAHAESPPVLDWGFVDEEGLHTHVFPKVIPHTGYYWLRGTFLRDMDMIQHVDATGNPTAGQAHTHPVDVPMPPQFTPAQAGDLLLVAWVGSYAIVIGVVVASLGIAGTDRIMGG